ncbi:MAG: altronate dehydratase, partial [Rhodobacteraceae bacterium]|nr:altronate dehydratase [Paracoccaceae bacterium]
MDKFVRLRAEDNVVIASMALGRGDEVEGLTLCDPIPVGHKIATQALAKGSAVRKFGQIIGYAAEDIVAGAHLHTHNIEFRPTEGAYEFGTDRSPVLQVSEAEQDHFMGYKRANGTVGTRNYIAIVTSVNCSATAARRIADAFGP